MSPWKAAAARQDYRRSLEQAARFIEENLSGSIRLEDAARAAALSPFHFQRIFAALMGETPGAYLNRLRLERAANRLIKDPDCTITEIAVGCGYASPTVFARAFRAHFGVTASAYRRSKGDEYRVRPVDAAHGASGGCEKVVTDLRIAVLPDLRVAYVVNRRGYSLEHICAAWERLRRWAQANACLTPDARWIGLSLDDPFITARERCRYFACLTLPPGSPARGVDTMQIEGGACAICRAACTADEIAAVYRYLYAFWLPESGRTPAERPVYEVYLQTPETSPDGKYLLEVCLPLV